jgi:integrase
VRPRLFEDAAKEYETWSKAHKKNWQTDTHWLKRLKKVFAGKTLDELTPEVVERFKLELAQSRTKATVNRHLALLRHLFNRAIRRGYEGRNPVSAVGLFREENTRSRWLTGEEERELFKVIPEPYWSLCRVALYAGCRKSELLAARWDLIDWERGLLTLPTSKSGKPRFVELSSNVMAALNKVPGRGERPLIFPDCRKVSHRFPEWAAKAKLPGKVTFHTLRHTFASRLVMAGVDLLTVKALGGWNRLEMVERYSHLAPAHKRAAVEQLAKADPLSSASGTYTGTGPSAVEASLELATV